MKFTLLSTILMFAFYATPSSAIDISNLKIDFFQKTLCKEIEEKIGLGNGDRGEVLIVGDGVNYKVPVTSATLKEYKIKAKNYITVTAKGFEINLRQAGTEWTLPGMGGGNSPVIRCGPKHDAQMRSSMARIHDDLDIIHAKYNGQASGDTDGFYTQGIGRGMLFAKVENMIIGGKNLTVYLRAKLVEASNNIEIKMPPNMPKGKMPASVPTVSVPSTEETIPAKKGGMAAIYKETENRSATTTPFENCEKDESGNLVKNENGDPICVIIDKGKKSGAFTTHGSASTNGIGTTATMADGTKVGVGVSKTGRVKATGGTKTMSGSVSNRGISGQKTFENGVKVKINPFKKGNKIKLSW